MHIEAWEKEEKENSVGVITLFLEQPVVSLLKNSFDVNFFSFSHWNNPQIDSYKYFFHLYSILTLRNI